MHILFVSSFFFFFRTNKQKNCGPISLIPSFQKKNLNYFLNPIFRYRFSLELERNQVKTQFNILWALFSIINKNPFHKSIICIIIWIPLFVILLLFFHTQKKKDIQQHNIFYIIFKHIFCLL